MRLQLHYYCIQAVKLVTDSDCYIDGKTLYINKQQLIEKFSRPTLADVDIMIASPGESCRIVNVGDVVEPRAKPDAPETAFPGFLGEMSRAGNGITTVLRNVTVMEVLDKVKMPSNCIVDMSGPAADYTGFSKTHNVAFLASPGAGVDVNTYFNELKTAVLSISRFLAELAFGLPPDTTEVFELTKKPAEWGLPKVINVWISFSHAQNCEVLIYGHQCLDILPTIIHPNEVLDGAMINRNYRQIANGETTYALQNHPGNGSNHYPSPAGPSGVGTT